MITSRLIVGVYLGNLGILGPDTGEIDRFKLQMKRLFKMSDLGFLSFHLGIKVQESVDDITIKVQETTSYVP